MANTDFDNTNKGSLFINKDKHKLKNERDTSKWASMQGKINIYGVEFYLSAWTKIIKSGDHKGDKFQSLSVKPVDENQGEKLEKLINEHILMKGGGSSSNKPTKDPEDLTEGGDDLPF